MTKQLSYKEEQKKTKAALKQVKILHTGGTFDKGIRKAKKQPKWDYEMIKLYKEKAWGSLKEDANG